MGRLRPSQNMKLLILSILALLCAYAMAGDCTTWVLGMKGTKVTCASGKMCIALCMNTAGTKVYTQSCDTGGLCSSGSIGNGQCKYKSTTSGGKKVTVTGFCNQRHRRRHHERDHDAREQNVHRRICAPLCDHLASCGCRRCGQLLSPMNDVVGRHLRSSSSKPKCTSHHA